MSVVQAVYQMVYRCECGWSTIHYAELDKHEVQPGEHFPIGSIEDMSGRDDL